MTFHFSPQMYPYTPFQPHPSIPTESKHRLDTDEHRFDRPPDGFLGNESDPEEGEGDTSLEDDRIGERSTSQSTESKDGERSNGRKKKPRITLARGGACVACR